MCPNRRSTRQRHQRKLLEKGWNSDVHVVQRPWTGATAWRSGGSTARAMLPAAAQVFVPTPSRPRKRGGRRRRPMSQRYSGSTGRSNTSRASGTSSSRSEAKHSPYGVAHGSKVSVRCVLAARATSCRNADDWCGDAGDTDTEAAGLRIQAKAS